MIHIHEHKYVYLEEVNEGCLRQFPVNTTLCKLMVLDVGCGSGALSEAIQKRGYRVWGIELNKEASRKAGERIERVINVDITDFRNINDILKGQLFDYIVFSDVLEHLYDPFNILKEYLMFLKPNGYILISVPNIVVWTNRIKFLLGNFNYSDTGVMDRTHIRFFTFKTAKLIIKAAGCKIIRTDFTPYFIRIALPIIKKILLKEKPVEDVNRRQIMDFSFYKWYMKYLYPIEYVVGHFWKPLFAFRIIILGEKI